MINVVIAIFVLISVIWLMIETNFLYTAQIVKNFNLCSILNNVKVSSSSHQ